MDPDRACPVIALVSSLTVWVKRQALDTDSWTKASVGAPAERPGASGAVGLRRRRALHERRRGRAARSRACRRTWRGLAAPLAGALRGPAVNAVNRLLERPRVQQLWEQRQPSGPQRAARDPERQSAANVSTANGDVVLDLRSFIIDVGTQLGIGDQLEQRLPQTSGRSRCSSPTSWRLPRTWSRPSRRSAGCSSSSRWSSGRSPCGSPGAGDGSRYEGSGPACSWSGLLLLVIRRVAGNYVVNALTTGGNIRDAAHSTWLIARPCSPKSPGQPSSTAWSSWPAPGSPARRRAAVGARAQGGASARGRPGLAWTAAATVFLLVVWWGPTPALHRPLGVLAPGRSLAVGFEGAPAHRCQRVHRTHHGAGLADGVPAQAGPATAGSTGEATTAPRR